MQGEKGSLLELLRYHRDQHFGGRSRRQSPSPGRESPAAKEEKSDQEDDENWQEDNARALRALQARLQVIKFGPGH